MNIAVSFAAASAQIKVTSVVLTETIAAGIRDVLISTLTSTRSSKPD